MIEIQIAVWVLGVSLMLGVLWAMWVTIKITGGSDDE